MNGKSNDLKALAFQIEQAQQAAERHRVEYETTIRYLINYREQEPRRLNEEIAAKREQAARCLAADERRINHLRRIADSLLEGAVVVLCGYPECSVHAEFDCGFCNERFCGAHGWPDMPVMQGKKETTAICWRCEVNLTTERGDE